VQWPQAPPNQPIVTRSPTCQPLSCVFLAELLDAPGDLMPGAQRKENTVAVADPTGVHDHPYVAGAGL
jgi:hypothetical protein